MIVITVLQSVAETFSAGCKTGDHRKKSGTEETLQGVIIMKNIRKVLAAILALTMTVCLASCGETGGNDNAGGTAENSKVEDSKTEEKEESKAERE